MDATWLLISFLGAAMLVIAYYCRGSVFGVGESPPNPAVKEMTAFFGAYAKSFEQDPVAIAAFYSEPCVTARGGVVRVNSSQRDTIAFFTEALKQYRSRGFTHGNYLSLDWQPLGANSILATLRWAYKDAAGKTIWETTFSYNLYQREGAWKILLQTMHDQ